MPINLGNILDGLGGGGSGSGSSGTNPSNAVTSLLTGAASAIFPGLGNVLSGLLGGIRCLGNQAMTNKTYDEWMGYATAVVEGVAKNMPNAWVQGEINQWAYVVDRWQNVDLPKLVNPCSKDICKKCIELLLTTRDAIFAVYNVSDAYQINIHGVNVWTRTLISRKAGTTVSSPAPVNGSPTTTVPTPVLPSTPAPVQPATPAPVFTEPVVIKEPNGNSTTYLPNPTTGTTVVSTFNPKNSSTVASTVPTSSLNVGGYYDENGNWQITVGQNKENYMPYILGAAGLLGLLLISKKR